MTMDVKIDELIADICVRLRVEREQLMGQCRKRNVVEARTVLVLVLDEVFKMPSMEIGRMLGKEHAVLFDAKVRMEMLEETGNGLEAVRLYRQLTNKPPLPEQKPVPALAPDPPKVRKPKKVTVETKRCERCGRTLPVPRFYTNRNGNTGVCMDCYRETRVLLKGRTCKRCVNYPCFWGMDSLDSDFAAEGCVNYEQAMPKQLNG